jgi:tyrosinase
LDERKDVADLDTTEKENFTNALLDLKNTVASKVRMDDPRFPQPTNRYDDYVVMHMMAFGRPEPGSASMIAHRSPTFLPWHRAYLRLFERELQRIKPEYKDVTIPYWDWTSERSKEAVWNGELMGGNGRESDWRVMDGKFAYDKGKWNLYLAPEVDEAYTKKDLRRRHGYYRGRNRVLRNLQLPQVKDVEGALNENPYDGSPWITTDSVPVQPQPSFRNRLEGFYGPGQIHNIVHPWVGGMDFISDDNIVNIGAMSSGGSPNDPVFWLHHANIDRLWADWQLQLDHWNLDHKGYQPVSGGPPAFNANDGMLPWYPDLSITPADVADFYRIDSKGYRYSKYFRDGIKDREEEMEALSLRADRTIFDETLIVNFDSMKGSLDELVQRLRKPLSLFPIS